jgi:hypothetical protein
MPVRGVTTSQGISLKGDNMETAYRSAMRVVDDPGDHAFPRASTRIPDVVTGSLLPITIWPFIWNPKEKPTVILVRTLHDA